MNTKGIAPVIIIIAVAVLIGVGFMAGRTLKVNAPISTTTTEEPTTTTTEEPTTTTTIVTSTTKATTSTTSGSAKSSEYCLDWDLFADNAYKDGQVHEEIKRIQEKLGVDSVGGHYGPKTQAAIKAFNKKYNIHQVICCGNRPDYTQIYQGTIAKFNELYCDKPLHTIKITRKNTPIQCTGEEFDCNMRIGIVNYNDTPISIPINDVPATIKVPYSASVMITLDADFSPLGLTTNVNNLLCYISKVYSNNTLVAYYEPGERFYAEDVAKHSKTIDLKNFFFDFDFEGAHKIQIKNVKSDYTIQIETIGCHSSRG